MQTPDASVTFLEEAAELLNRIEEIALDLRRQRQDPELLHELFRAFHTIKGSGAMFAFTAVAEFTHHVETVLDKVRSGLIPVTARLADLVLAARDQIQILLDGGSGKTTPDDRPDARASIIAALNALAPDAVLPPAAAEPPCRQWRIFFRPDPAAVARGMNPGLLFRELRQLGRCAAVARTGDVPDLNILEPERCYLWWEIDLETDRDRNAIQDVFIFVEDGSDLRIEPVAALLPQPMPGPFTPAEPVHPVTGAPPVLERRAQPRTMSGPESVVRVPSAKLDRLVNLVGELVMNQSRLQQAARSMNAPELSAPVEAIERVVAELRDNVLGIRMTPIGSTFGRFQRLVHDVSAELGKEIELVTEGAATEVDKSVLDQLADPLVHLIRNSVDHGIEPAEERARRGKSKAGRVTLAAAHTGSSVVVRVADDGRGLDAAAIRAKAIEKNLISPEAQLSETEIFHLIFLPGFSTARQVSSLSGRGVGMDVVKKGIEKLRGSVNVSSVAGHGTTISLTLPLTLAIIDGLLVEIDGDRFIVPMSAVIENVELHRAERFRNNGRNAAAVRGELIPYIRLREIFGRNEDEPEIERIVIARHEDQSVGLVVDRVLGSHQTVIQSMGRFYSNIGLFSGATIMGDGRVALIIEVPGTVQYARKTATPCRTASPEVAAAERNAV